MEGVEIIIGGIEAIAGITGEWIKLCEEGASNEPFFRPEWFSAFVNNFEKKVELVTVRHKGRLRAVLPLVKKRGGLNGIPVTKLQALSNLNTQRFDLVHGADDSERKRITSAVWNAIKGHPGGWDVLEVRLVDEESWFRDVLDLAAKENYPTGIWQMDSAPYIALPRSGNKEELIENYFTGPRKHLKQELNRRLRRLREMGTVEFVTTSGCSPAQLQTYLDLEAKGWKGRGGTALANDPCVVRMHEEFVREVTAKKGLRVYELKLDGQAIAMILNINCGNKTIHWKTSYDEDYSKYSPGNILFRELLSDSVRNDSSEIDFMSPVTPNKKAWASDERRHVAFYIFRRGLWGSLLRTWKFGVMGRLREFKTVGRAKMLPAFTRR